MTGFSRQIGLAAIAVFVGGAIAVTAAPARSPAAQAMAAKGDAEATFAGGCFWSMEASFEQLKGVKSVVSGYAGGQVKSPSYEAVCSGTTGHAEAIRVTFDPKVIAYEDLLVAYFAIVDPTTLDRQGADEGTQYRSAIFTHTPAQAAQSRAAIERLGKSHRFGAPIVTAVLPATVFFPAEDYHQDYFKNHPMLPYSLGVIAPKVAKIRHALPDKTKE